MIGWGLFWWYWYGAHKHFIASQQIVDEHRLKEIAAISNFDVDIMRVQEHNLGRDEAEMDISTSENMNSLANVGRRLLDQQAERNTIGVTNRIALKSLASFLHHKRKKSCKSD
ncbi:hypothetical protein Tco_0349828 [Tanacetum coccineum]